ncbi:hypothetical protein GGX14DRAFT_662779 [Mycena pura]|uniref:Uncharacterized protein n=1 Tax=Mycena pura TaxID=153505 RepID=A0AAD6YJG9_9AGAR|nr:hypothetical protein GGX14DRAFT_662779 [Mycena pura]
MPPTTTPRTRALLALLATHFVHVVAYIALMIQHILTPPDPIPYHTSTLSGYAWFQEVYNGHPDRIHCELGVRRHIFNILLGELRFLGYSASRTCLWRKNLQYFSTPVSPVSLSVMSESDFNDLMRQYLFPRHLIASRDLEVPAVSDLALPTHKAVEHFFDVVPADFFFLPLRGLGAVDAMEGVRKALAARAQLRRRE